MTTTRHPMLLLAAAMLLLAPLLLLACAGSDDDPAAPAAPVVPQTVAFDAYLNRGTTRGGATGTLTTDGTNATTSLQTVGFGVFAYYTDSYTYNQLSLPNFMYNQQVVFAATAPQPSWTYSPLKYWPNEKGSDGSSETDRLSFFAYAPYTPVDAVTGRAVTSPGSGITALNRTNDSGDPLVRYCASLKPAEAVDLCWGTPHIDQTRPTVGATTHFDFRHALAALNVQIDTDVDVVNDHASTDDHSNALATETRIWVRSITFQGFALKGQLNLNNDADTPLWYNLDCDCDLSSKPVIVYDGRRDTHEGVSQALNEQPKGLNPAIVQSGAYTLAPALESTTTGVTNTAVNLFDVTGITGDAEALLKAPVFVLPTNDPMRITIEYDVETYDPKLTSQYLADGRTHGSSIKSNISTSLAMNMQAGKQYTIGIHLGMASVKVDATVSAWPTTGTSANVDVPK